MFYNTSKGGSITLLILTILAIALVAGCSSKSVKDDESATDTGTAISVSASPASVTVNNTAVVEAVVTDNSVGVAGQIVRFTVSPSQAGYFTPDTALTDANGIAASVFTASTEGAATISAQTDFTDGAKSSSTGVAVAEEQQESQGNVSITVSPSLLLANGSDTSLVTITCRDGLGQPVPDSTVVTVVAGEKFVDLDANGVWSPGIDSLVFDANGNGTWDAAGQIASTVFTTGGTGQAQTPFVSGNSAGTVYIKATVTDESLGGTADKSIQLNPNAEVNSIFLNSDTINLVVKGTGGMESAILEAVAYDVWGNPVPEGMSISFIITDGPGGGERLDTVGYGPYEATTNSQGVATCPIQSGTMSGTVRIRAQHGTVLSNASQIMVSAGPPAYIVAGTEYLNIDYWATVGEEVGITAVVSDIYLNPVPNNTAVYFSCDEGTMKSHEVRTRDLEGVATTKWISGNQVPTADGIVEVVCETAGGTVADTTYFINSYVPDTLYATSMPTDMLADGESQAVVWVSTLDLNRNFVIDGTTFEADAMYLTVEGGVFSDGVVSATDRIKITSSTLREDFSLTGGQDNGIGAVDYVYFAAGGASETYAVNLLTGNAYTANCQVNGPSNASVGEQLFFSVTIMDRYENPLGDHTVVLSAASGTVNGATQNTIGSGEALGFSWTPTVVGDVNLVFTDTDPRGGVILTHSVTVE